MSRDKDPTLRDQESVLDIVEAVKKILGYTVSTSA
jgi:hypothetical protein